MMNVVLTGIFYPMAILRYFEAALRRRADVVLYTAGPWTGAWIPWNAGMHLPARYATAPDLPLPQSAIGLPLPIGFVEAKLPWQPDLWLQVDAGWRLHGRPRNGKNVVVGTDPHVLNYDPARQEADVFYCMQACYGRGDDHYLPYAYDPVWHAPEDQPRRYDACLLGLHYEQRDRWVKTLRERGMNVCYDLGPVFDEARALYNQAPIGLNWSSLNDLNARVFELLGMRRLAVVNRVPDLATFFRDGSDLVVFDTLDEAVEKTLYYHAHPDEAEAIAARGHETVKPHTWDARVAQILREIPGGEDAIA
jgi:hypothetical protein